MPLHVPCVEDCIRLPYLRVRLSSHFGLTIRSAFIVDAVRCVQGSLVGIVGRVGSGKSALLSAIAAELYRAAGRVVIGADVLDQGFGFVTQDAWTQHATLRDNILFGRYYDRRKYDAVINACALVEDLKVVFVCVLFNLCSVCCWLRSAHL